MATNKRTVSLSAVDRAALKAFGNRIREIRVRKKLSVYDLSGDEMPIKTRQHWQQIEMGKKNINLTTVLKIARSLEVSAQDLIRGIE